MATATPENPLGFPQWHLDRTKDRQTRGKHEFLRVRTTKAMKAELEEGVKILRAVRGENVTKSELLRSALSWTLESLRRQAAHCQRAFGGPLTSAGLLE